MGQITARLGVLTEFHFCRGKFEMPIRHPVGYVEKAAGHEGLDFT